MRIYQNCNDAVVDIGRELRKCSTTVHTQTMQNKEIADNPDFETKEIQAFDFAVIDTSDRDKMPGVTLEWCKAEFKERISPVPVNPGVAYKLRPDVWNEFLVNGQFEYTYSERYYWQVDAIIEELRKHPQTRQAILQVHDRCVDQDRMGKMRVPCSMFYHFMFRNGRLDVIYNMRSSDFATHFQNDMWLAMELQKYIAGEVGEEPGKFIMQVSSLHCYRKDWENLDRY